MTLTKNTHRLVKHLIDVSLISAGLILVLIGVSFGERFSDVVVGIGCSLIAGAIVSLLASMFYARVGEAAEMFGAWGLKKYSIPDRP